MSVFSLTLTEWKRASLWWTLTLRKPCQVFGWRCRVSMLRSRRWSYPAWVRSSTRWRRYVQQQPVPGRGHRPLVGQEWGTPWGELWPGWLWLPSLYPSYPSFCLSARFSRLSSEESSRSFSEESSRSSAAAGELARSSSRSSSVDASISSSVKSSRSSSEESSRSSSVELSRSSSVEASRSSSVVSSRFSLVESSRSSDT